MPARAYAERMPFTVEVAVDVDVEPEVAFDTLADHDAWREWMPRSFRPVGPSLGTLRVGMKVPVRIQPLPMTTPIAVRLVERPGELTWTGGSPGMRADHRFVFEARKGGGTRIRSIETWSGVLARVLKPVVKRGAERVGRALVEGLKKGALARAASPGATATFVRPR